MNKDNPDYGFVYVLEVEPGKCKIGYTRYPPDQRTKDLSTKFYKDFTLLGFFESETAAKDEKNIHEILSSYRLKGEWFDLTYEAIKMKLLKYQIIFSPANEILDLYEENWKSFKLSPSFVKEIQDQIYLEGSDETEAQFIVRCIYEYKERYEYSRESLRRMLNKEERMA